MKIYKITEASEPLANKMENWKKGGNYGNQRV